MLNAQFTNKVGTAPGTSTVYMPYASVADMRGLRGGGGLGVISEKYPWYTGRTTTPPGLPGTVVVKLNNQGGAAGLAGANNLGLVNNEVIRSLSGNLGIVPTDEELGRMYGYTPVEAGWIVTGPGKSISALGRPVGGLLEDLSDASALQKRQIALQTVTTGAFVTLALVGLVRLWRDLKHAPAY